MAVYHQFKNAKAQNKITKADKLRAKFAELGKRGPQPTFFTHEDQVLPLCAQFIQELKNIGFDHIRVTAYKAPVCQYWADGAGQVRLDTSARGGHWGAPATPEYTVNWL